MDEEEDVNIESEEVKEEHLSEPNKPDQSLEGTATVSQFNLPSIAQQEDFTEDEGRTVSPNKTNISMKRPVFRGTI